MKLSIVHRTEYQYDTPARYCIQYLRLTPRSDAGQHIHDWRIDVPGRRWRQVDAFGNIVHVISIDSPYQSLRISAQGAVETALQPGEVIAEVTSVPLASFLVPTTLTQPDAAITALARQVSEASNKEDAVQKLMQDIHGRVRYETGSTDVEHTAAAALAQGSGVCQDHAHILVASARAAGLPARYVSGYIDARDGGHVSSHAWADVWIPDRGGWVSFDATHLSYAGTAYCRLAVGRDFLDASPVRGMRHGGTGESLQVRVAVSGSRVDQQ